MEEGRYYGAATFEPLMTRGASQTETSNSRSGFCGPGARCRPPGRCEETVGRPLRASCGVATVSPRDATREEKRGAERKKRLAGKLEPVNVACQQHGPLAYAINSCVTSDDRP